MAVLAAFRRELARLQMTTEYGERAEEYRAYLHTQGK
jgi:hypothetical protein